MAERRSSSKSASGSKAKATSAKPAGRRRAAEKQARTAADAAARAASEAGLEAKTVAELREALRKNLIRPLELVMLTRERIEEVLSEAVERGQITVDGAHGIASDLVQRGRKQTNDVLKDLEQLMDRGFDGVDAQTDNARKSATGAVRRARKRVTASRTRATRAASPALAQADKVRRVAKAGPSFPITGYDDLTAAQVQSRLGDLTAAQLRKVRDRERRGASRKTVLGAIEKKLG